MKYTPDFSSRFRILKGGKVSLVVSALLAGSTMSFASPTGGTVTSGSATINQNGSVTTINQSTNKASINWQDFSIGKNETVNFVQPSSQSVTLNRVVGASKSLIEGAMHANGQVFLLNPNGVLFANGSQINVGGLIASTLNITDANFQAGKYIFEGNSQNSIINMGTITTAQGGYVAMMGKTVQNEGTIVATMGNVQLASGEKISLNLNGNSLVKLIIDQGTMDALVENKGLIKADGGQVYLTTQALNTILDGMVNNTGIIEASSLTSVGGKIALLGDVVVNNGSLLATGKTGGGEILVGGDVHGSNADIYGEAKYVLLGANSIIDASATGKGNGGKIAVWSNLTDGYTLANGVLKAEGGVNGGNGGFIETSAHTLNVAQGTSVSTNAPKGRSGSWLLDPVDIVIYHSGHTDSVYTDVIGDNGEGYVGQSDIDFNGGSYTPTNTDLTQVTDPTDPSNLYLFSSATSYIADSTIEAAINAGTSVFITTYNNMQSASGDITLQSGVSIINSNAGRDWQGYSKGLYLMANRNIIADNVTIGGTDIDHPLSVGFFANNAEIRSLNFTVDDYDYTAYYFPSYGNPFDGRNGDTSETSLNTTGYIKVTNSTFNTFGGHVGFGGQSGGTYYATGDATNPGVLVENTTINTAGSVDRGGYVSFYGGNNGTSGTGVKIINSTIDTATGAARAGSIMVNGVATGGDAVNISDSTLKGNTVYVEGNVFAEGTTAADSVGIRMKNTTVGATNVILREMDGFDSDSSEFPTYTSHNTDNKAMGMSLEGGTVFQELSSGDGVNLEIDDKSFYGVSFGDSANGGVSIGSSTGALSVGYSKETAGSARPFSYVGSNPLTLHSNGSGTLWISNYSSDWHDTNDYYPTIVGGSSMGSTSGIWFSDTDLNKWVKSSIFDKAIFNDAYGDNDLIIQNYNPTAAIDSTFFHGSSITLKNTATIKKSPVGMAFVTNAYDDTNTFNDEGAAFTGTGNYNIYVWNSDAVIRTALTQSDADYYYDDRQNEFSNNQTSNPPPVGSYVLCADGTCGGSINGGSGGGSTLSVQPQVNNIVTTIVNQTTVIPPLPVVVPSQPSVAQTQTTQLLQTIMPQDNGGEHFNLVGMTDGLTPVQTVSMEQLQSASGGQGIHEIRVPLGHDSIVELINGGVNLPKGLSQEFYVIADNTQQDNK